MPGLRSKKPVSGAPARPWFTISAKDDPDSPAQILIYDQIGKDWWTNDGVSAKEFADALAGIPRDRDIEVFINSPGGNVWDGLAIYHQLRARGSRVKTYVDGVAASIASIIALAGEKVVMPKNALMMIHEAAGFAMGNATDMEEMAEMLRKHDEVLAGIYAARTGQTEKEVRKMMKAETWMSGAEALDLGFCDECTEEERMAACAFDLKPFSKAPAGMVGRIVTDPRTPPNPKTPDFMNRERIIAALKKLGQTVDAKATDEQLLAQLDAAVAAAPNPPPPPAAPPPAAAKADDTAEQLKAIRAQMETDRKRRITAELEQLAADNANIDAALWLPRAVLDETVLNDLRKLPRPNPGEAAPILMLGGTRIEGTKTYLDVIEEKRKKAVEARMAAWAQRKGLSVMANPLVAFLAEEWDALKAAEASALKLKPGMSPRAANTTSATITTSMLIEAVTTILQNQLAPLAAFGRDFGSDRYKPRATLVSKKVTAGGTVQTNATNFEDSTNFVATATAVSVTMAQKTVGEHITNTELNSGYRMMDWATIKAAEMADALWDVVLALFTVTNYTNTPFISADTSFDAEDMRTLWGMIKKAPQKNLILDGEYFARLLPSNLFDFGIDTVRSWPGWNLVGYATRWSAAGANVRGMACAPQIVRIGAGLPLLPESAGRAGLRESTFVVPGIGLSVALCEWFSLSSRTDWATLDLTIGAAVDDASAGVLVKSA
jgi:ATP-dependent Clp endopeptidase proteolytic subunit ClpP